MQDIKEVVFVLNQIIEKISKFEFSCIEKPKCDKTETAKNFLLTVNKDPDQYSVGHNYNKISQEDAVATKNYNGICEESTITSSPDFENLFAKSLPTVKIQHEKDCIFETCLDHLDQDVVKCNISNAKSGERSKKDVCVQTISHSLATRDNYCQCDLILRNGPALTLDEYPSKKKMKLKTDEYLTYRKTQWKPEISELPQAEYETFGNEKNYSDSFRLASYLKRTSHIRVGLSKRFKPHAK